MKLIDPVIEDVVLYFHKYNCLEKESVVSGSSFPFPFPIIESPVGTHFNKKFPFRHHPPVGYLRRCCARAGTSSAAEASKDTTDAAFPMKLNETTRLLGKEYRKKVAQIYADYIIKRSLSLDDDW
jgi:hypothetical protein